MAWVAILSATAFFVVALVGFLVLPCNVDRLGWACFAKWNTFAKYVVRAAPAFVCLALFARKGTRIQLALSVVAVAYDCILVSASA